MKCNSNKINEFFSNDRYDRDFKDFVLKLIKYFCELNSCDVYKSKFAFLDLGFYEIEKNDDFDDDYYYVIDFFKLSNLNSNLRAMIFELMLKSENEDRDFFTEFMYDDLKIFVPYEEWNKVNRKNKLTSLKNIK